MEQNIVDLLQNGINFWNGSLRDIRALMQTTPDAFAGGTPWAVVEQVNHGLQGIGYGLLILFFLMSFFKTTSNFKELSLQQIIGWIVRFILVKVLIDNSVNILNFFISISMGVNHVIFQYSGDISAAQVPQSVIDAAAAAANGEWYERIASFFESLLLALMGATGTFVIWISGIIMVVVVYLRFFRLFIYSAIAPIPLSTFGSPETSSTGKHFIKAYAAVCLEICVIALACVIFNAMLAGSQQMFASWSFMGGDGVSSEFWGTVLNFIMTMVIETVMLAIVVTSSNKFIKEIMGV